VEEVLEEEAKNKCQKFKQLKKVYKSHYKIFITETCLKYLIKEQDAAINVLVKEDKVLRNAKLVKGKAELSKCIKWVLECISKFKKIVINVKGKEKLSLKVQNAKLAMVKRLVKNKK
jgi:hypothetical protein